MSEKIVYINLVDLETAVWIMEGWLEIQSEVAPQYNGKVQDVRVAISSFRKILELPETPLRQLRLVGATEKKE